MAVKPGLSARQTQRLSLTPALRQSLMLLHLPTADLLTEIARQAQENPLLLVHDAEGGSRAPDITAATRDLAQAGTLAHSLQQQISLMPLDRPVAALAQFLTGDLTEDGYLDSTPADLSDCLGVPLDLVEAAIAALQACEPAGVAARDLAECLALQLIDRGVPRDTALAACAHLDLLAEARWKQAERQTGLPRATLEQIAATLRILSPRPASGFAETARPLIPELVVERDGGGGFTVTLNRSLLPEVRLDAALLEQLDVGDPLARSYRGPAEALITALAYRGRTLRQVAIALTARQHRFFTQGPDHMAPLTRAELADTLGLHPSTVGRAMAGKALSFGGMVYPLDHFLSSGLTTADGGRISAFAVQRSIRRIIEHEAAEASLSDDKIAALLQREGVDIARRTVAKYRGCMKIPSSFERSRRRAAQRTRPVTPGSGPPDQP
ncbi:RNA polymerase factor sigma-54 [Actibacterium sp. D379-3]